jgi:hypothetical protein
MANKPNNLSGSQTSCTLMRFYTIISRPKKSRTGGCDLMLSITECKKILNRKGINYTNEEVEILRETLYKIAEIVHSKKN